MKREVRDVAASVHARFGLEPPLEDAPGPGGDHPDPGRGTSRVIKECRRYGVDAPTFEEQGGTVVVRFWAPVRPGAARKPERDQVGTKSGPSPDPSRSAGCVFDHGPNGAAGSCDPYQVQGPGSRG
jgi:hypothetical protein